MGQPDQLPVLTIQKQQKSMQGFIFNAKFAFLKTFIFKIRNLNNFLHYLH